MVDLATDPVIIEPLGISGRTGSPGRPPRRAWRVYEWYRPDLLAEATGADWCVRQANVSQSRQGALLGSTSPRCLRAGQVRHMCPGPGGDVVVDIRVGSLTFGRWIPIELDAEASPRCSSVRASVTDSRH